MSNLEPKYALFGSVEEMLAPETLGDVLARPVTRVDCSAPSAWGNAGSKFSLVDTNVERLVLKTMSTKSDWEMFATDDHRCRSVTLWSFSYPLPVLRADTIAIIGAGFPVGLSAAGRHWRSFWNQM
jgi:hypothetical protein